MKGDQIMKKFSTIIALAIVLCAMQSSHSFGPGLPMPQPTPVPGSGKLEWFLPTEKDAV